MPKFKTIKGHKIPLSVWKTFVKRIRDKDNISGSRISPKLFKILLDKLLSKTIIQRRKRILNDSNYVKKSTISKAINYDTKGTMSGVSSTKDFTKSDNAINATIDKINRDKLITDYNNDKLKTINPPINTLMLHPPTSAMFRVLRQV